MRFWPKGSKSRGFSINIILLKIDRFAKMKKEGQYTLLETLSFLKHYLHYLGTTGFGYFRLGEWKKKKSQSIKPQDFSCFSSLSSGADGTRTRDPRRDRPVF